jgi:hypothetical protein
MREETPEEWFKRIHKEMRYTPRYLYEAFLLGIEQAWYRKHLNRGTIASMIVIAILSILMLLGEPR